MRNPPTIERLTAEHPRYEEARSYLDRALTLAIPQHDGSITERRFPQFNRQENKPVDGEEEHLYVVFARERHILGAGRLIDTPHATKLASFNIDPDIYTIQVEKENGPQPVRIGFLSGLSVVPEWRKEEFVYQDHPRYADDTSIGAALAEERIQSAWDLGIDVLITVCRKPSQGIYRRHADFQEQGTRYLPGTDIEMRAFLGINPASNLTHEHVAQYMGTMPEPGTVQPPLTIRHPERKQSYEQETRAAA